MTDMLKLTNPDDAAPAAKELSFEGGLKELEDIVTKMEAGQVSLDDAVRLYERGMALQKRCQKQLEEARLRIEKIALKDDGELTLQPFEDVESESA